MSFHVLQAGIHDLDRLVPLFDGYRQFYGQSPDVPGARVFLAERFRHQQSLVLIALDQHGKGLGFVQLYPSFSSVRMVGDWVLNDLFVDGTARRQGIAAALLEAAAVHARALGVSSLSLTTGRENHAAQSLYESLGWQRDQHFCSYALTL